MYKNKGQSSLKLKTDLAREAIGLAVTTRPGVPRLGIFAFRLLVWLCLVTENVRFIPEPLFCLVIEWSILLF